MALCDVCGDDHEEGECQETPPSFTKEQINEALLRIDIVGVPLVPAMTKEEVERAKTVETIGEMTRSIEPELKVPSVEQKAGALTISKCARCGVVILGAGNVLCKPHMKTILIEEAAHDAALTQIEEDAKLLEKAKSEPLPNVRPADDPKELTPTGVVEIDETIRLMPKNGEDPTLSPEEYKEKFNRAMNSDVLSEVGQLLFNSGPYKPISQMQTLDEVQDYIRLCQRFITEFRIVKQRAVIHLEDELSNRSDSERERLRKRDREYKVKTQPAGEKKAKGPAKSKHDKAVESLMNLMSISREQAEAIIKGGA